MHTPQDIDDAREYDTREYGLTNGGLTTYKRI